MSYENETVEIIDKSVEGAIEKGLEELGVRKENANIEIINEPGSGFLGFLGNKQAKVNVSVKQGPKEYVEELMKYIMQKYWLEADIQIKENEDNLLVDVSGNDLGVLIGRRGQNLNSLQYLTNVIMHRQFKKFEGRVILDVENYRQEREDALKQLAQNTAFKVEKNGREITLEPMTPQERRIIHITLKNNAKVDTYSSGEEPNRKVVISPR